MEQLLVDYNNKFENLNNEIIYTQNDINLLSIDDFIAIRSTPGRSGVTGFVKKVNRKFITIETEYMNSMVLTLKINKFEITKFLKNK